MGLYNIPRNLALGIGEALGEIARASDSVRNNIIRVLVAGGLAITPLSGCKGSNQDIERFIGCAMHEEENKRPIEMKIGKDIFKIYYDVKKEYIYIYSKGTQLYIFKNGKTAGKTSIPLKDIVEEVAHYGQCEQDFGFPINPGLIDAIQAGTK